MQEQQVTVDLETVPLPRPFLIIATQNPVELEGTFPLPEAQLDRFLLSIKLGYPEQKDEEVILSRFQQANPLDTLQSVATAEKLLSLQKLCRKVAISDAVRSYVVSICRATRTHKNVELGASPRASLGLFHASQAMAAVRGRNYVIPDDVKMLAAPVLAHRLITRAEARLKGQPVEKVIESVLSTVAVPVEK
jgi:MoxR-like ATPase